ncbi:MAG: Smr/MutS family protein [Bdellovibrionaceae bacterium]|nr:Smr/MutS family protein [Pseudobdellovibrionaceae bacterium]
MTSLENLDWDLLLKKIEGFCTSAFVKSQIEKKLAPKKEQSEAIRSFDEIAEASQVISSGVRPFMESLDHYANWIIRLRKKAVLKTIELRDIRTFCMEILALREALKDFNSPWCRHVHDQLMKAEEPLSAIDQLMSPSGEIRTDASEKLYRLYNEKNRLRNELENQLDRLVKDFQMESYLQEKYVTLREGRLVIPVKSGMQHYVPGVIHASSQTKQTVYIEPEKVIPLNNRLRQIDVEIEEEIDRLLEEISKYLFHKINDFETSFQILEHADLRLAQAQLTIALEAKVPEFSTEEIDLIELKHPSLILSQKSVISNSVQLNSDKSILLLSGPNAGGKTVLLKSIGLAAQMARSGMPICAQAQSKLPFFKEIIISIGDSQSVDQELSTFAAHLKVLQESSKKQSHDSLILIDEICGSTDPEEGSSLARSFIECYSRNNVFAVITSHLSQLKMGWNESDRVMNGSLEYDQASGKPTYQFLPGIPGQSFAIQMAKRQGVSNEIITRAVELLSPETRARMQTRENIEELKKEVQLLQQKLKKEIHDFNTQKNKYEKLVKEFNDEKSKILEREVKSAKKKVEDAIQSANAQATMDKHRQLQEIKFNLPEIVKAQTVEIKKIETADEFIAKFPAGSKVFITSLGQDGIIQSHPNAKGEITVFSNSLRLQVHWTELKPPDKQSNPTANLVRKSSHFSAALVDEDRTVDLRGKTVEEAINELEDIIDRAVQNQEDRIKVIHGHGTEVLKKSIRSYLSRSVLIKQWKAGTPENGGDGVTWVVLAKGD